ncbi:MAG: ATP-dependent Clp protease adaptor ClpS [bacterium]
MQNEHTAQEGSPEIEDAVSIKLAYNVILFNDDWHSFDEVINQIIKAIRCSYDKATSLTLQVHLQGKSVVYSGDLQNCLKVSSILEEIALHTQIES